MKIITLEGIKYAEVRSQTNTCAGCDLDGEIDCSYLDPEERDLLQCGPGSDVIYQRCAPEEQEEEFFRFTPHREELFAPVK